LFVWIYRLNGKPSIPTVTLPYEQNGKDDESRRFLSYSAQARDKTVDIARGAATLIMTFAHHAACVLSDKQKRSIWVRLAASFAAPLFIVMSGMMVGLSIDSRGATWHSFLNRGVLLILISSF
jgi:uncharacterized membrane protein